MSSSAFLVQVFAERHALDLSRHQVDPGARILQAPVHRLVIFEQLLLPAEFARPLINEPPDAVPVGIDLAMSVRPDAAAGAVAHLFGAAHRAGEGGIAGHALPAGLASKQRSLDGILCDQDALIKRGMPLAKGRDLPGKLAHREAPPIVWEISWPGAGRSRRGSKPASSTTRGMIDSHMAVMICTPLTPGRVPSCAMVSTQISMPSSLGSRAASIRAKISPGIRIPGTRSFIYTSDRVDLTGITPARM